MWSVSVVFVFSIVELIFGNSGFTQRIFSKKSSFMNCMENSTEQIFYGSLLECGTHCANATICNSFHYHSVSMECVPMFHIHTDINIDSCIYNMGMNYFIAVDVAIGTSCIDDIDCPIQYTVCNGGMCVCMDGYTQSNTLASCDNVTSQTSQTLRTSCACYGNNPAVDSITPNCTDRGVIVIDKLYRATKKLTVGCTNPATNENRDIPNCCTYDAAQDCQIILSPTDPTVSDYFTDCSGVSECIKQVTWQQIIDECSESYMSFTNFMCIDYFCV